MQAIQLEEHLDPKKTLKRFLCQFSCLHHFLFRRAHASSSWSASSIPLHWCWDIRCDF